MVTCSSTWPSREVSQLIKITEERNLSEVLTPLPCNTHMLTPSLVGLPQLPLLYALVSTFKADITLKNSEGLNALCLAAKLGEEKLAEVHTHSPNTCSR